MASNAEASPGQFHLGLALRCDFAGVFGEELRHVGGVGRGPDGGDGNCLRNPGRRREYGCATETVSDQQGRGAMNGAQPLRGGDEILDVRREVRVGELALAVAESGEVEAQHGDATPRQSASDARRRGEVLRAREAMGEQRERARSPVGTVEPRRQPIAGAAGEIDPFAAAHATGPLEGSRVFSGRRSSARGASRAAPRLRRAPTDA